MRKYLWLFLFAVILLNVNSCLADEVNKNFNPFSFGVKAPVETAEETARKVINKTAMKAQISSIKSKINNTSSLYQSTLDNLANNLLPEEQLKQYNEIKENTVNGTNTKQIFGIYITQDGAAIVNKFLKSNSSKDTFEKLTATQKYSISKDLLNLKLVSGSYTQIVEQAKTLTEQIKSDKTTALELKADITDLVKMQFNVSKQSKTVDKLIENLINSASNGGFNL